MLEGGLRLDIYRKKQFLRTYKLTLDQLARGILVGSAPGSDLRLEDAEGIAERQSLFLARTDGFRIRELTTGESSRPTVFAPYENSGYKRKITLKRGEEILLTPRAALRWGEYIAICNPLGANGEDASEPAPEPKPEPAEGATFRMDAELLANMPAKNEAGQADSEEDFMQTVDATLEVDVSQLSRALNESAGAPVAAPKSDGPSHEPTVNIGPDKLRAWREYTQSGAEDEVEEAGPTVNIGPEKLRELTAGTTPAPSSEDETGPTLNVGPESLRALAEAAEVEEAGPTVNIGPENLRALTAPPVDEVEEAGPTVNIGPESLRAMTGGPEIYGGSYAVEDEVEEAGPTVNIGPESLRALAAGAAPPLPPAPRPPSPVSAPPASGRLPATAAPNAAPLPHAPAPPSERLPAASEMPPVSERPAGRMRAAQKDKSDDIHIRIRRDNTPQRDEDALQTVFFRRSPQEQAAVAATATSGGTPPIAPVGSSAAQPVVSTPAPPPPSTPGPPALPTVPPAARARPEKPASSGRYRSGRVTDSTPGVELESRAAAVSRARDMLREPEDPAVAPSPTDSGRVPDFRDEAPKRTRRVEDDAPDGLAKAIRTATRRTYLEDEGDQPLPDSVELPGALRADDYEDDESEIVAVGIEDLTHPPEPPPTPRLSTKRSSDRSPDPRRYVRAPRLYDGVGQRVFPLVAPVCRIGRSDEMELTVRDRSVSKHHATIHYQDGVVTITDHESRNRTRIFNRLIQPLVPTTLKDGDLVFLGKAELVFMSSGSAETTGKYGDVKLADGLVRSDTLPITLLDGALKTAAENQRRLLEQLFVDGVLSPRQWGEFALAPRRGPHLATLGIGVAVVVVLILVLVFLVFYPP